MISDPIYIVFTCLLIKKEILDKLQIMMFLSETEIKIFELLRINTLNKVKI